jgi:hypothetical protein
MPTPVRRRSRLHATDIAWNAAVEQVLRAIDARLATEGIPCRSVLEDLRSELTLLIRSDAIRPNPDNVH